MFVIFTLLLVWNSVWAQDDLTARMEKVLQSFSKSIQKDQVGLAVLNPESPEKPLYTLSAERELIPASVTKLVTAAAVMRRFPPGGKLQTTLWSTAPLENGVLKGDLILKGGGDPGFVSETMWFLVNELVRSDIRKITGKVIVDDRDFDSVRTDSSRSPERVDRAYDAPIGAMSFNWNSINIYIRPGKTGKAPIVYLDPIPNGYKITNKAKTVSGSGNGLAVSREGEKIVVSGKLGAKSDEVVFYKNIDDPAEWSARSLIFFLKQRGIEIGKDFALGSTPDKARLLAKADSKPVQQLVADMLKFSNNYVAEMLTKDLAMMNGEKPATLDGGMKIINSTLEEMGVPADRFKLINPSGLSRENRMRPLDLALVLVKGFQHFPTFAEYLSALPLAGIDGTLKSRMKNTPAQGWVRAKTGLLTGAVALAGFAGRKDGSVRAFAFIFNGKGEQGDSARKLFDALAAELVQ
ncbi:MAG: D-alanyl-D-alanine carboxypeptidase/D-alanyl-D-alanine-endopeptidase [Bdellovibrionales bacterium]